MSYFWLVIFAAIAVCLLLCWLEGWMNESKVARLQYVEQEALKCAARLEEENERLREALEMIYDRWEDGDPCYEDVETQSGFLGNAVKLSYEEENELLFLIPSRRKAEEGK